MKGKSIQKAIILVSTLAVPGFLFFYLLPQFAKNRYKSLPVFGEKVVASTFHTVKGKKIPDTIYHQIPDFKLINQSGDSVSWATLKDKITVLNLVNTEAPNAGVTKYLQTLAEGYEKKPLVKFLSLSVNPADVTNVKAYAAQLGAKPDKWNVLAGDTSITYPLIRKGLLLDIVSDESQEKPRYIFSNKILLIDVQHRIRGVYETDSPESTARLEDEIKVLIAEYLRNVKDGR
ncbi:SCO family protein [Pedobacter sp. CFBP9032]|uniref:SCO family protein n=1 Tax=Pedobacter sp. CFBP9032 TaxID=3096539 RepID=UPI002A6A89D2|nr:SCO family protein [Pedobacter sp. CFBP9032]MDY0903630.1 SCO family protein [Pedobacter sp. CFBP9032]